MVLSFLAAEWIIRPPGARGGLLAGAPLIVALAVMILSHYARGENPRTIGWRLDNFLPAARSLLPFTLGGIIFIGITGWVLGGGGSSKWREWKWVLWLPLWALIQQYALQGFINRRAQIVFGIGYRGVLLVALVFAVLHLPNTYLVICTFIGGLVWAKTYQRFPNLFVLSLSHALLSLMSVATLPASILHALRVGIRYLS